MVIGLGLKKKKVHLISRNCWSVVNCLCLLSDLDTLNFASFNKKNCFHVKTLN